MQTQGRKHFVKPTASFLSCNPALVFHKSLHSSRSLERVGTQEGNKRLKAKGGAKHVRALHKRRTKGWCKQTASKRALHTHQANTLRAVPKYR